MILGVNPLSREGNSQTGHRMPVRALGLSSMAYVSLRLWSITVSTLGPQQREERKPKNVDAVPRLNKEREDPAGRNNGKIEEIED